MKEKFLSRKLIVATLVTLGATAIFLFTAKLTDAVWADMVKWIIGIYLASNAASKWGQNGR